MLQPTSLEKPAGCTPTSEEQKKMKRVQQSQQRTLERKKGTEIPLYVRNPSMLLNAPVQQKAAERVQMHRTNPGAVETTMIDNLCTQLEGLTLNEREDMINHLHIAQGEPYSQLVQSAWRKRSNAEGIYLSIQKSMQLHVFIHLSHKRDEAAALLDSGTTENFIQESYAQQLKLPVKCLSHT